MKGKNTGDGDHVIGKILIVEDNFEQQFILSGFFKTHQFISVSAINGKEAITLTETINPDIVLLDINLPDISGYEVCKKIKANRRTQDIPVIFLSALNGLEDRKLGFDVGGADYITKPYINEELLQRIQVHLELRSLRLQLENKSLEQVSLKDLLQFEKAGHNLDIEKMKESFFHVEESKTALLNLLDDLETEVELRKINEKALRLSEQRFRDYIDNASDIVYTSNREGFFTFMSPNKPEYKRDIALNAIGSHFKEFVFPEDINICKAFLDHIVQTGESITSSDYRIMSADGSLRWYSSRGSALRDANGTIIGVLGVARDITERKIAEESLQKSESQYRLLADHMTDTLWLMDLNLQTTYISPSVSRLSGFNLEEIRQLKIEDLISPSSLQLVKQVFSEDMHKILDGTFQSYSKTLELEFKCKNGSTVWLENRFSLIRDENGNPLSILAEGRDISDRRLMEESLRKSEEKLSFYIMNSPMAAIEWDSDFSITQWTGDSQKIFGWKAEETIGKTILDLNMVFEPDIPLVRNTMERLSAGIYNRVISSNRNYKKNRTLINCEWYYTVLKDKQGKMLSTMTQILDVTERKKAEHEIQQLNQKLENRVAERTSQLEAVNIELEAFTYSVSHDLQAPLRHISGFINLFLEKKSLQLNEEELSYLTTVTNSAKEMVQLIDALLTFSRLNRTELKKTPLDTAMLIRQGLQLYEDEIKRRKIKITIGKLEESYSDLQLMRQVWTNLISNAVKYTTNKENALIEIGSYLEDNHTVFYIKDNGAGFNMKYYDKLFGVFQRLHKPRDFEGVGIGLANVKRVVSRHGGRCWAEGKVGKGAAFYFSLPNEKSVNST